MASSSLVVFRVDASLDIGSGHIMRCLTLADTLRAEGADCHFLCRVHPGSMLDVIRGHGHVVHGLPVVMNDDGSKAAGYERWLGCDWATDANQTVNALSGLSPDWLVVDHYALDHRWEATLTPYCRRLMVIDDLADRLHDCDLLLDQNLGRVAATYMKLVPEHCAILAGPQYALLRPEFAILRAGSVARRVDGELHQILVSLGGVDKDNVTGMVLEALNVSQLPESVGLVVVMGGKAPWLKQIRELAATMPWRTNVLVNTSAMAQCMIDSDLAIGAAGGSAWERCSLGLPTLLVVLADNQRPGAQALASSRAATLIGEPCDISDRLPKLVNELLTSKGLAAMAVRAAEVTDGEGVSRVLSMMRRFDV